MSEEKIDLAFDTKNAMKSLDDVAKRVESIRKSAAMALGGAGQIAGAALGGSATGQAISQFAGAGPIDQMLKLLEVTVRTLLPGVISKLDVLGYREGALAQIKPLFEQAGRLGINFSDKDIDATYKQALAGEQRASDARSRVESRANLETARQVGVPVPEDFKPLSGNELVEFWKRTLTPGNH